MICPLYLVLHAVEPAVSQSVEMCLHIEYIVFVVFELHYLSDN